MASPFLEIEGNIKANSVISKNSTGTTIAFLSNNEEDGGLVAVSNPEEIQVVNLSTTGTGANQSGFISVRNSTGTQTAGINGETGDVFGNSKSFIVPDPTNSERMI